MKCVAISQWWHSKTDQMQNRTTTKRRENQNKTKETNMNMTKNEMANYFARVFSLAFIVSSFFMCGCEWLRRYVCPCRMRAKTEMPKIWPCDSFIQHWGRWLVGSDGDGGSDNTKPKIKFDPLFSRCHRRRETTLKAKKKKMELCSCDLHAKSTRPRHQISILFVSKHWWFDFKEMANRGCLNENQTVHLNRAHHLRV